MIAQLRMLKNLSIRNAAGISKNAYLDLFEKVSFKRLNLAKCNKVNDEVIAKLIEKSPRLEKLVLSWNDEISD